MSCNVNPAKGFVIRTNRLRRRGGQNLYREKLKPGPIYFKLRIIALQYNLEIRPLTPHGRKEKVCMETYTNFVTPQEQNSFQLIFLTQSDCFFFIF